MLYNSHSGNVHSAPQLSPEAKQSLEDILLTGALKLNGLSEREVKIVAVGGLAERVGALQVGRIDGAMLLGAQMLAATKLGFKELINSSKLPFEVSLSALISARSFAVKQPEITFKFLKAWAEGIFIFKSNRELSRGVLRKYTRIEDRELLEDSYNRDRDLIELEPLPSLSAVKSMLGILAQPARGRKRRSPPLRGDEVYDRNEKRRFF